MNSLQSKIALFVSVLFQPLCMPTFGILLIMFYGGYFALMPIQYKWIIISAVALFTLIIPVALILILIKAGLVKNVHMPDHKERVLPIALILILFAGLLYLLYFFNAPTLLLILLSGSALAIGIAGVISFWWKISAHLTGMGGFAASAILLSIHLKMDYSIAISILILLSGIVAWARLELEAHTLNQVYAGFFLGFISIFNAAIIASIIG